MVEDTVWLVRMVLVNLHYYVPCRGELNIPKHISILHVEQEIRGDDTPALQSVLMQMFGERVCYKKSKN